MKEHPILFSGPMVRAILDGRKTQTRRVVMHQGKPLHAFAFYEVDGDEIRDEDGREIKCPYGSIGDRLWVRETIYWSPENDNFYYSADKKGVGTERYLRLKAIRNGRKVIPSIHMPRWASRLTLEITGLKVDLLNEISEEDAIAEGIFSKNEAHLAECHNAHHSFDPDADCNCGSRSSPEEFARLWDSINGERPGCSWSANPRVRALTVKVVTP